MRHFNIYIVVILFTDLFYASFPSPPSFPGVEVVASHEKIEIIWNMNAENSIDLRTGYADFEGYRIYRSTDGGITWGDDESDKIYDYDQSFVGWKPYAQFDLFSELDSTHCIFSNEYYDVATNPCAIRGLNVQGYDVMAEWVNIGDNSGISRSFIDEEVLDGVEYTYAVTAYDIGMISFDLSYTSQDPNGLADDYCDGDDSYCDGMECCSNDNCCQGESVVFTITNKSLCEESFSGIWLPSLYSDEDACSEAGYVWQSTDKSLFLEEYYRADSLGEFSDCNNAGYEWNDVVYLNKEDCELANHTWNIVEFTVDTTWSELNPDKYMGYNYGEANQEIWGYPSFESSITSESFADLNLNGICDYDEHSGDYEPFFDNDSSDTGIIGKCDQPGDLTSRCPLNNNDCINVVVVEPGYKSSNYTEPSDFPELVFIKSDSTLDSPLTNKLILNRGNGERFYKVVNEYDLTGSKLRFEVNAGLDPDAYGDQNGSFQTMNPGLFIYEINDDLSPKSSSQYAIDQFDTDSLEVIIDLPGVTIDSSLDLVSIPDYKVDNFRLLGVDNPQHAAYYTDWFDGIQFRFDNGPNRFTNQLQLVQLKEVHYSDTLLAYFMNTKMRYKDLNDLSKRLMYKYRVEFYSSFVDTAIKSQVNDCPSGTYTQLPFKVKNLVTNKYVGLEHNDGGIQEGEKKFGEVVPCDESCGIGESCFNSSCRKLTGYKNCQWEYNELIVIVDSVYTTNPPNTTNNCRFIQSVNNEVYKCEEKIFDLKMGFFKYPYYTLPHHIPDLFEMDGTPYWCLNNDDGICTPFDDKIYEEGAAVIYEDMIYIATKTITENINPALWYDENSDGTSDNPWQISYPWSADIEAINKDTLWVDIEPYGWYQDGDAWIADLSQIGKRDEDSSDDLQSISVVPNPYIVDSGYFNESNGNNKLQFTHLPDECTISIYTVSGELIKSFIHDDPYNGSEWWGLKNDSGNMVAPGLYIYVVQTPFGDKKIGKFAVVR